MEPDICEHLEKKNNNGFVTARMWHSGTKEEMNSYIQKSTSEGWEESGWLSCFRDRSR